LYERVGQIGARFSDAPAICFGERVISYRALLELAHQIAGRLLDALGSGRHRLIAVWGSPRPEFVASILAVLENGWTYLPLDSRHPKLRNDSIMQDASADAALLLGVDGEVQISGVGVYSLDEELSAQLAGRAYVMYTSGSTGAPKGSAASVAAVLNVIDFMRDRLEFGASSTMLGVTNFAWDLSVPDIYLPLTTGGRLALVPPDDVANPAIIARSIERHEIDLMQASPSMWKLLVDSGWPGRATLTAVAGGEALPAALARELIPRCSQLWNFYGPAECTVWSSCALVRDPERISLGSALPQTGLHILRDDGAWAAPQESGEIVISGVGVANGYLRRPALTAEKFITIDTPAGAVAAYRTGDLGCLTGSGELFFQGRRDLMLKIRGHRIEAREIEDHLERHPDVRQAVVFGRSGGVSDTLCAVVVAAAPLDVSAVRDYLRERLPEFMVPSEITVRTELPLNANMKLDRRRVIADFSRHERCEPILPRDLFELEILEMVSQLIQAPVGLDDNLFDGTLHSLAIVSFIQRLNKRIDGALTFADLQKNPTVTHLAGFLRRANTSEFRQLIELNRGTTRRTLVLFHPGGGTCLPYKPLLDLLPPELTVYGVECPNLYRPTPELFTVEQMVERYYPDIAAIAADGPVALGGWSLGGYISYEVARRFRAAGRPVRLVLLMDSVVIDDQLQQFAGIVGKPNVSEFLRGHFSGYWEHLTDEERERQRVTHEIALDATLAYKPGPYDDNIVLAKAGSFDELPSGSDIARMQEYVRSLAFNGWETSCTGKIRVEHTPTKHNDLVSAASAPMLARLIVEHFAPAETAEETVAV
jgi:amino acid adenylation domain-containing protein